MIQYYECDCPKCGERGRLQEGQAQKCEMCGEGFNLNDLRGVYEISRYENTEADRALLHQRILRFGAPFKGPVVNVPVYNYNYDQNYYRKNYEKLLQAFIL